ncbi:hypothetical protein CEXT_521811 [Caerostris extrusa]|uniref:Uncharacterized protein n=1 Tax=Caerostris extrusa TaxID=172846 RepID=A0AAV4VBW5_CAEEX|nr:hypothetical protein CEXT_521811 [Caerostris extrusa]
MAPIKWKSEINSSKDGTALLFQYDQKLRCNDAFHNTLQDSSRRNTPCPQVVHPSKDYQLLEVTGQEKLKIIAFGGKEDIQSTIKNRVRFLSTDEKTEHTMIIEALETETICPNIMAAPTLELRDKITKLGIDLSDVSRDLNQEIK